MANYKKLITIDELAIFKQQTDLAYASKGSHDTLAGRVKSLEDDDSDANVIEIVKVNGTALTPDASKAVDVTVPTRTSQLTNNSNFVADASYVHTDNNYTGTEKDKLSAIEGGAQVNVLEGIKINGSDVSIVGKRATLGTAATATKETTLTDGGNLPTGSAIKSYVEGKGYQTASDVSSAIEGYGYQTASDVQQALEDSGFEANAIEAITVGGTPATVTSKTVALGSAAGASTESTVANDSKLPTGAAVKNFVEGKGYQTAANVSSYVTGLDLATKAYVATAIGNASHIQMSKVSSLPATGEANIIYLVPDDKGKSNKDMYIWDASSSSFVLVGNTEVDLSGYVLSSTLGIATTAEVQALFA